MIGKMSGWAALLCRLPEGNLADRGSSKSLSEEAAPTGFSFQKFFLQFHFHLSQIPRIFFQSETIKLEFVRRSGWSFLELVISSELLVISSELIHEHTNFEAGIFFRFDSYSSSSKFKRESCWQWKFESIINLMQKFSLKFFFHVTQIFHVLFQSWTIKFEFVRGFG